MLVQVTSYMISGNLDRHNFACVTQRSLAELRNNFLFACLSVIMDQDKNPKKACGDVPVAVYYPTAGVKSDFETLLKHFSETQSVRYEHFLTVWHEMKMSFIFAGRQHDREVREVSTTVLQ